MNNLKHFETAGRSLGILSGVTISSRHLNRVMALIFKPLQIKTQAIIFNY